MTRSWIRGARISIAIPLFLLWAGGPSSAATMSASTGSGSIAVGEFTEIQVQLDLGAGEDASIFEGRFDLVGSGSTVEDVVASDLVPGGPSWGRSLGGIVGTQAQVSLTSSNAGGSRLVATLTVTGKASGTFQIELGAGTFAQRDINVAPFFEDVPLTTPVGTVLATVTVDGGPAPVPALGWLGLVLLAASLLASQAVLLHSREGQSNSAPRC